MTNGGDGDQFEIVKNASKEVWMDITKKIVSDVHWAYSEYDYANWLSGFPAGAFSIYFAIDKTTGQAVGTVSLTIVTIEKRNKIPARKLSIIGIFYVLPDYRKRKLGIRLWNRMLEDTTDDRFLYGAGVMWKKYRDRDGFTQLSHFKLLVCRAKYAQLRFETLLVDPNLRILDFENVNFDAIAAFDARVSAHTAERVGFLRLALSHPGAITKVALNDACEVVGFCRIRWTICHTLEMGPVYANEKLTASSLIRTCIDDQRLYQNLQPESFSRDDKHVYWRNPSTNTDAIKLFQELIGNGEYETVEDVPQFTKEAIQLPVHLVYSSFEGDCVLV